jgi:hypothetical protein
MDVQLKNITLVKSLVGLNNSKSVNFESALTGVQIASKQDKIRMTIYFVNIIIYYFVKCDWSNKFPIEYKNLTELNIYYCT